MEKFKRVRNTLVYARLGLVSLGAAIAPISLAAQELCASDLFAGEPDEAELMAETLEFIDILENGGVTAFHGKEGRLTIQDARQAIQDGVGSAFLLSCVVDAEGIEFSEAEEDVVVSCDSVGMASVFQAVNRTSGPPQRPWSAADRTDTGISTFGPSAGKLFCTTEVAAFAPYLGSQA